MEATELMIGNVLSSNVIDNNPLILICLAETYCSVKDSQQVEIILSPNQLQGYPLNDNILLDLGFKQNDNVFTYDTYDIVKEDDEYTFIGTKVKYIHEVQNILKTVFNETIPLDISKL